MARANKRAVRASAAWRLGLLCAMLVGGWQLMRQQREIDELRKRLGSAPAPASVSYAPVPASSWETPAPLAAVAPRAVEMNEASEGVRHQAQQHYLAGVIYYQKGDYVKARAEWLAARQVDPSNEDAEAGLQRLDAAYSGR
jgi:hypothetical protein